MLNDLMNTIIRDLYIYRAFSGDYIIDNVYISTYNKDKTDNGGLGFVVGGCWYGEYNDNEIGLLLYDLSNAIRLELLK